MSENLKALILEKRKNRATRQRNNEGTSDDAGSDRPLSPEQNNGLQNLIPRIVASSDKGEINPAFEREENGNNQTIDDDAQEEEYEPLAKTAGPQVIQTAIINKHRDKSRELLKNIKEEDPNKVKDELNDVRDKIKDKIKGSFLKQLSAVRQDTDEKPKQSDLKLDLTAGSTGEATLSTGRETGLSSLIQQKIKKIQQQAGEKTGYRVIGDSKRETTRFDESDLKEDADKKKLEKIQEASLKRKFQKIGKSVIDEIHMPNQEEQFEFFASVNWPKEEDKDEPIEKSKDKKSGEHPVDETIKKEDEQLDEGKVTDKTPLIDRLDEDWREISYNKANYLPHQLQKFNNGKLLFMPKTSNIPLKRKLGEEKDKARLLENEGFYVGNRPYMTIKNRNMMEDRFLRLPDNRGMKWFGVDGQLIALSDPIKYVSTRPSFAPSYTFGIESQYRKALYVEDFANNLLAEKGELHTISVARYRIDLDINQVQFGFHHLFSGEHVLAFKLQGMYDHYKLSEDQNIVEILSSRLKALKEALERFKNELAMQTSRLAADHNAYIQSTGSFIKTSKDSKDFITTVDLNRLNAYKNEIKQTRQQRDIEMKQKKNLIEKILITWRELKELRKKQNFRTTDIKLIIKKKEANKSKELKLFEKDLQEEFEELISEKREEYNREMAEYELHFKAWKFQQTKKNEAKKRQEERAKNPKEINTNINILTKNREMEENDLKIINEEDLRQPNKPVDLDENKILEDLRNYYIEIRKVPGEPILYFELIEESDSITPTDKCTQQERIRRNKLSRTKVYIKIFLNEKLVYTTKEAQLQSDFSVVWEQIFNIYMISFPDSIYLKIYDYYESKSKERKIAEINLPMPEFNCTSMNYQLEDYEFSSKEVFHMNLKISNQIELFYTSGVLKAGAGWGIDEKNGNVLVPPVSKSQAESALNQEEMKMYDPIAALGVSRMQDMEKLAKWIMKSNLDPNDPRNADLINLIRNITDSDGTGTTGHLGFSLPEFFRLDQMIQEFNFSTDEEIENNRRFRLISLRAQDEPEFRGFKMIPAIERYVKRDQFDAYEKRKIKDITGDEDDEKLDESISLRASTKAKELVNEIELSRIKGQKIVRKIRERIIKQFKFTQTQKTLADMVIEEQVPNINLLSNLFWTLYVEPRRPLYPSRRERKKVKGQNVSPDEVSILVNIVNAYDLPVRKEKLSNDPMKVINDPISGKQIKVHEHIAGESLVRPFVEVTFQEAVYRTATADGPNASWNQGINIAFKAPNDDLRPESLQTCKDNIYLNVFDEVIVDALEDERDRDNTIHKRIQRYWLGTLKIPFSTVYFKSKIEGTFKIETPPIMLGYTRDPRLSHIQSLTTLETAINMELPTIESSYLSLYVTIEPQLLIPEAYRESYDSIESIEVLDKASEWTRVLTTKFPNREFKPTVMNTEGKSVLVTRYFRAIKPPDELIENGETSYDTASNISRFVSMIPYVADSLIFPGVSDIWSTCDQFLEILSGDEEEHSVMLVNLFLGVGKKAWLLIGSSITNGSCACALSIENGDYTIWYQGHPYKVNEHHNPIKVVSAIVNDENIWFNVQPFEEPYKIKYDVNKGCDWRPFFVKGENKSNKFESIQPEKLSYFKTEPKFVKELETKIETKLMNKLQEWRPRHITKFNRNCSAALRQVLSNMEKIRSTKLQNQKDPEELTQIMNNYRISGFPINLPYTNLTSILEAVYASQVHAIPSPNVEFALAVQIFPYPNTILSVWVYVASLIRK